MKKSPQSIIVFFTFLIFSCITITVTHASSGNQKGDFQKHIRNGAKIAADDAKYAEWSRSMEELRFAQQHEKPVLDILSRFRACKSDLECRNIETEYRRALINQFSSLVYWRYKPVGLVKVYWRNYARHYNLKSCGFFSGGREDIDECRGVLATDKDSPYFLDPQEHLISRDDLQTSLRRELTEDPSLETFMRGIVDEGYDAPAVIRSVYRDVLAERE